jgi:hypothetical protein
VDSSVVPHEIALGAKERDRCKAIAQSIFRGSLGRARGCDWGGTVDGNKALDALAQLNAEVYAKSPLTNHGYSLSTNPHDVSMRYGTDKNAFSGRTVIRLPEGFESHFIIVGPCTYLPRLSGCFSNGMDVLLAS